MPLELRPLTKDDAPEATRILVASYENDRFRTMVFPNGLNQNTINIITRSRVKSVDESDHYPLKIVDTDNGDRIAACAVWAYTKAMSDDDWDRARDEALSAYPEARKDILDEYMALEQDMKRRIMGHTRWWELLVMNTQPEYQRRGIASMLMKWGTDKLEEMRWPGIIVSTDQGHGLYVKHGFREVEHWEVDMGQWPQYGGSGMYRKFLLTRFPSEEAA